LRQITAIWGHDAMTMQFRALAEQAAADGAITAEEILALRRSAWPDGRISPDEAEALFVLNDHIAAPTPEWSDAFVEALTEFVVNGTEPHGHVAEPTARWLTERISHDGRVESLTELELLVRVLEKALSAPETLRLFAQQQIEEAVLSGKGPTRREGALETGRISAAECALLRRMIFASGSDRPAAVSRNEAELLFRIKDASLGADNAPEWERLFVQGVGNYLQGWQGAKGLTRDRAAELETFMNDRTTHVGRFFGRMARVDGDGFAGAVRELAFGRRAPERDIAAEAGIDQAVTDDERMWLNARIDADDQVDPLEQALLRFLDEEA
jgi:hypothetical protein